MWIRSQDRNILVTTDFLYVGNTGNGAEKEVKCIKNDNKITLGEYKSEERALEVLDMIQTRIIKGTTFDYINNSKRTTKEFVFQMPEE